MTMLIRRLGALLVLAAAILPASGAEVHKSTVMVAMHDGVHLATDVYRSESQQGPLPVILMRTPYGKGGGKGFSGSAVQRGYVLVVPRHARPLRFRGK